MILKTGLGGGVAAAILATGMMTAAHAADWKFAIEEIDGSVQDRYAQEFKRLIEEKSGGDITVTVYPYGSLGTSAALTELVTQGAIQFANSSPGHLGTLVSEVQVFSIPYLLSQNDEVNKKVLNESDVIYETLQASFHEKNLHLLTMYPEGEMVWTANKEIRSPEDFDNFKMRTMVSPMLVEAYSAFGASPTPMPYGEVYGGLQLKQIDGQVNPVFAIQEMKFYEVQDYMIFAGQQEFTTTVVTNNDWFQNELTAEQRKMVNETIDELADFIFDVKREFATERLDMIKEAKPDITIIELTEEERAVFREAAQRVRDKYVEMTGESGKKVLEGLQADIKEAEKEMGAS
ncbi:MAG: TRAP transporter substrate-binding protein DctP [Alphaproteobacteria bacterium]|nr:TRAP transporter substrate-binding protein DctP [Alphaproteobacteria bacterium]MDX5369476.1 TRAP transporter substrate-binding protein DctP [Alphaproteobacteria bacterium]